MQRLFDGLLSGTRSDADVGEVEMRMMVLHVRRRYLQIFVMSLHKKVADRLRIVECLSLLGYG